MRTLRTWAVIGAAAALAIGTAACGSDSSDGSGAGGDDSIKIAFMGPLTGDAAVYGTSAYQGFQLAVDQINAEGNIKLSTTKVDTKGDPTLSVSGVQRLIGDGYEIVVGPVLSGETLPVAPICQARKVICITPGATHPDITKKGDFIFRAISTTPKEMEILMDYAVSEGKKRAAVLYDDGPYGTAGADAVKESWSKQGGEVVAVEAYTAGAQDFRAQLGKIKAENPDILFTPGYYTELGLAVRQARDLGIDAQIAGPSGLFSPDFVKIAGQSAADGAIVSTDFFPNADSDPLVQKFVEDVKAKFNVEPDENHALGYDTVQMIAKALEDAKDTSDITEVKDALADIEYDGVTGADQTFQTPYHDINKQLMVLQVSDGKFVSTEK